MDLAMQINQKQSNFCMECGVCTGSCPVSRELSGFSPRQMIKRAMMDPEEGLIHSHEIWACLSCSLCSSRCPVEIDFPEFIRSYREKARKAGNSPQESHHGIMQTVARIQQRDIQQDRIAWAREAGSFQETGDYFYFVGCLPYFDVVFNYLEISPLDSARSVLSLLNRLGIEPVISNDERCCGHDALWSGDEQTFRKLAERNVELIQSSGAKTVLFSCAEGYNTFKLQYPKVLGDLPFETLHMTEFLERELPGKDLSFQPSQNGTITYHDPCRLGRGTGIYEQPREILKLVPETRVVEMSHNRENAICCGTSAWMECSNCSRNIRLERLHEAVKTGAKTLITACPKCQIHFTCAQRNAELDLKVEDLYAYIAGSIKEE